MLIGADGSRGHEQGRAAYVRGRARALAELGNVAAIAQGLRTALVCFASFALGQWALGQVEIAVFATFTGLALCGIADFGGTLTGRFLANAVAAAAGLGLAALGTWASYQALWLSTAVTFVVGAIVVLSGLFGGYAAAGSNALILFYLVASGSPAPVGAIPGRLAGVALGGLLAAVASVSVWPAPRGLTVLTLLGTALLQAGRRLLEPVAAASSPTDPGLDPRPGRGGIRTAVDSVEGRPSGPTQGERAALYLVNDIERLDRLATRIAGSALTAEESAVAAAAAAQVITVGRALSGLSPAGESAVASVSVQPARPGRPVTGQSPPSVPPFGLAARLRAVTAAITVHAEAAAGKSRSGHTGSDRAGGDVLLPAVLHGARRVRANLSTHSVHVHDAVRTGAALAIAFLLARLVGLQHGFWVELATLTVIRSTARSTGRQVGLALAGTTLGILVSFGIIAAAGSSAAAYTALMPVTIAVAIYARSAVNFLAGQAGFTVAVIVLFSLLRPAGWQIGVIRLDDVLAGALAGFAASVVAWPRGATASMPPAVAGLFDASAGYLRIVVYVMTEHQQPDGSPSAEEADAAQASGKVREARKRATAASVLAESAFAQFLAEKPAPPAVSKWSSLMAAANRLWYVGDLLQAMPAQPETVIDATAANDAADRMLATYHKVATALRTHAEVTADGHNTVGRHDTEAAGTLEDWLDDLTTQVTLP
jgi:uncharacterized membrane protein YccC